MPGGPELSEKVPDEIFQLVGSFKKFVREQKAYRDEKFDVDPILEVEKEVEDFMLALKRVSVESAINGQLIQQISNDTTKVLRHAELAYSLLRPYLVNNVTIQQQQFRQQQQLREQQQNQLVSHYFAELADQFEARMRAYGEQIKELKLSMDSIVKTYNADELFRWLKKQHETLGETAARVYMTHERIMEKQSELDKTLAQSLAQ